MASINDFSDFISYLKSSFDQSVVWHHQTDSYPVHKALGKFYDEIVELTDGLVESVSGIHGRPKGYKIDEPVNYKNPQQVTDYFKSCYDIIQKDREDIYQETWIQNQVDEIATLFGQTLYLLSLK
jgi:hypothetical protein